MPYPFAHPAAILPLVGPMGRFAVPSALAIGAMAPDLWYLVPPLGRSHSHSWTGLVAFCLPAGILAYLVFHLLLKQPLIALLPPSISRRLVGVTAERLPRAPWAAVLTSLLVGAATHVLWDAATHERFTMHGVQVLQHASTLLGTAVLAAWLWRWLREAAPHDLPPDHVLPPLVRGCIVVLLLGVSAAWMWRIAEDIGVPQQLDEWRYAMRTAGLAGVQALALSSIGYAVIWKVLR